MNSINTEKSEAETVKTFEFPTLGSVELNPNCSAIYRTTSEALPYAFFLKAPIPGRPLIIFGQGDQNRKLVSLPRFQRMDWANKLSYNVMIFSDPTLHLSDQTGLGWLLGTKDHYVLEHVKTVIQRVRDFLCIENRNLLFYGSSAGGFTSLMLASHFEDSSSLVNNPQTDVLRFTLGGVQNLLKLGFDGLSRDVARQLYGNRMSFVERIHESAYVPNIYYLQNLLDEHHYRDHMLPLIDAFRSRCAEHELIDIRSRFIVDLYSDAKSLHNPAGFEKVNSCISSIKHWFE